MAVLVPMHTIHFPFVFNQWFIQPWKNIIYKPEILVSNAFTYIKRDKQWNNTSLLSRMTNTKWWYWKYVSEKKSLLTKNDLIKTKYANVKTLIKVNSSLRKQYYYWNINENNVNNYTESQLREEAYNWKLYDVKWANLTWKNSKFKNNLIYEDNSKPWKIYFKLDNRYWYILDNVWYCWDWIIQRQFWEECEIWQDNCNSNCKIEKNKCWDWIREKNEECDYKFYQNKWYYWDDNPCTKNCNWKKPITCKTTFTFWDYKETDLWNNINVADNWVDFKNKTMIIMASCINKPKWWEMLTWVELIWKKWNLDFYKNYLTIWNNWLFKTKFKDYYNKFKKTNYNLIYWNAWVENWVSHYQVVPTVIIPLYLYKQSIDEYLINTWYLNKLLFYNPKLIQTISINPKKQTFKWWFKFYNLEAYHNWYLITWDSIFSWTINYTNWDYAKLLCNNKLEIKTKNNLNWCYIKLEEKQKKYWS